MDPEGQGVERTRTLLTAVAVRLRDATSEAATRATGLSEVEAAAVAVLATSLDAAPLQALADALDLTQPGATRLVDRLTGRGLVTREPGPDGRTRALRLTPAGRDAARTAARARDAVVDAVLDPLGSPGREELGRLLERLLEASATSTADAVRGCRLCEPDVCGHRDGRCPVTRGLDARGR